VADQNDRVLRSRNHPVGGIGIAGQGKGRVLHDRDFVTISDQQLAGPLPSIAKDSAYAIVFAQAGQWRQRTCDRAAGGVPPEFMVR